ncbi:MAG: pirin family protein [Chlamydiales bacterium]|nr:pirin family protein [Chlamydiales bacterium]
MEVDIYLSHERGSTETPWLISKNSFSFANYYHPKRNNFGTLRVLNEDLVFPNSGFSLHPHDNMEIVTIVLEGELEHRDTLNNHGRLKKGDVQRMSAGSGIRHSEMNPSKTEKVHFLQLWVLPAEQDLSPSYEQKSFTDQQLTNRLCPIVAPKKSAETLYIHQDASFFLGKWNKETDFYHAPSDPKHGIFVFLIHGKAKVGGFNIKAGDSVAVTDATELPLTTYPGTELLLIELSMQ